MDYVLFGSVRLVALVWVMLYVGSLVTVEFFGSARLGSFLIVVRKIENRTHTHAQTHLYASEKSYSPTFYIIRVLTLISEKNITKT